MESLTKTLEQMKILHLQIPFPFLLLQQTTQEKTRVQPDLSKDDLLKKYVSHISRRYFQLLKELPKDLE